MVDTEKLIERLRSIDLKALSPDELYDLIQEVRGMLDADAGEHRMDLDQRVRLLRVWHMLILIGDEIGLPARPEKLPQSAEPEFFVGSEAPVGSENPAEPENLTARHEAEEVPEVVDHATAFPLAEPDLVLVVPADHQTITFDAPAPAAPMDSLPEIYGPNLPPEPVQQITRIRMRMVKEGVLMNRVLPEGTIVLVYPLDADHLIEQGIAEKLPEADDSSLTASDFHEF